MRVLFMRIGERSCEQCSGEQGGGGRAREWGEITIGLPTRQKNRQRGNYLTSPTNLLQLPHEQSCII
jgi:hypothetical protein